MNNPINTENAAPELLLDHFRAAADALKPMIVRTPVLTWPAWLTDLVGVNTRVHCKLENLQVTGSFKARGALYNAMSTPAARSGGITAFSAGNHAIAAAFAAQAIKTSAKVVMIKTASPFRVARVRQYGGEAVFADTGAEAFERAQAFAEKEGRYLLHPFESPLTVAGNGVLALEMIEQCEPLDAIVVAVGGGGLAAGVATVFKLINPHCKVYGVEPEAANNFQRSLAVGAPIHRAPRPTIADSLAPPMCLPFTFGLCRKYLDETVTVTDAQLSRAMTLWRDNFNLYLEPAGAAATAAMLGPLKQKLQGRSVGVIVCGANIAPQTFDEYVSI